MSSRLLVHALIAASSVALPSAARAGCDARSGPNTAALIELYTSEGCSSCPPADRQLRRLQQALGPGAEFVPLALHVGYWDSIGWKDPYAHPAFADRQSWLVHANRQNIRYTPQFFVSGTELRSWRSALREKVQQVNAAPAAADIRVEGKVASSGMLALNVEATVRDAAAPAALYVAVAESGLTSSVTRGENSGRTLTHDHVARAWMGPVSVAGGAAKMQRDVPLGAGWSRARLEVIAFVQDTRTGGVLQAVSARRCGID